MNYNLKQKHKFNTKEDPTKDSPGYCKISKDKLESVADENKLQFNKYKDNSELNRVDFYHTTSNFGPGRGFGNLNISNDIRTGDSSRNDTKEFKESREKSQFFDYQFQYLDRNFQDPNHIVLPIPRGGDTTRTKTQLFMNPVPKLDNINFNY
jgi:hypothetical protein